MAVTVKDIRDAGYFLEAAPPDAWRVYDERDPVPCYFEFAWLNAYRPDLYHRFALSTEGLMDELETQVDLSSLIGAGF